MEYADEWDTQYTVNEGEEVSGIEIAYVDVTGEIKTVASVTVFIIIVMLFIAVIACILARIMAVKIENSQKAQKKFFENVSHELKTPLTAIRGFSEGMLTDVMTDYKKSSVIILKEVEKMSLMVEDILSSSKIESGAVKLHLESENLSEMIEECLMPLEGEIRKKNLDIRLGLNDFTINADSDKMCHALNNIIVNAIKYAKDYISIYNQKNILTIENDGCNLSDDELAHIFERFYTGRNGNTGIGLSLAKELIELHGWKLKAKKHDNQMFMTIEF